MSGRRWHSLRLHLVEGGIAEVIDLMWHCCWHGLRRLLLMLLLLLSMLELDVRSPHGRSPWAAFGPQLRSMGWTVGGSPGLLGSRLCRTGNAGARGAVGAVA